MARLTLPPGVTRWAIRHARVPAALLDGAAAPDADGLCAVDIVLSDGHIQAIGPTLDLGPDLPFAEAGGGLVLPAPIDAHTHLDKGHVASRARNPDGTRDAALVAVGADRSAHWTAEDVRTRMDFALRCAYAHGTAAIRTHIDSLGPQIGITWPVFAEMREAWAERVDLQASPLFGIEFAADDAHMHDIEEMVGLCGTGILGAVTYPAPTLRPGLERLFRLAAQKGYDLDFHVDETGDPAVNTLAVIAETALAHKFQGRVLAGHCCSLAVMPPAERARTIDLVARAGVSIVSLPMCNMYLQSRGPGTPLWRGTTAYKELHQAGVAVMIASDNTRDPFYAYGDLDMAEVWREGTRILHLDHPFGDWVKGIAATPATVLGFSQRGRLGPGLPGDLILFRARTMTEFMARPQSDRTVIRRGRPIDAVAPDYAELDHLQGLRP